MDTVDFDITTTNDNVAVIAVPTTIAPTNIERIDILNMKEGIRDELEIPVLSYSPGELNEVRTFETIEIDLFRSGMRSHHLSAYYAVLDGATGIGKTLPTKSKPRENLLKMMFKFERASENQRTKYFEAANQTQHELHHVMADFLQGLGKDTSCIVDLNDMCVYSSSPEVARFYNVANSASQLKAYGWNEMSVQGMLNCMVQTISNKDTYQRWKTFDPASSLLSFDATEYIARLSTFINNTAVTNGSVILEVANPAVIHSGSESSKLTRDLHLCKTVQDITGSICVSFGKKSYDQRHIYKFKAFTPGMEENDEGERLRKYYYQPLRVGVDGAWGDIMTNDALLNTFVPDVCEEDDPNINGSDNLPVIPKEEWDHYYRGSDGRPIVIGNRGDYDRDAQRTRVAAALEHVKEEGSATIQKGTCKLVKVDFSRVADNDTLEDSTCCYRVSPATITAAFANAPHIIGKYYWIVADPLSQLCVAIPKQFAIDQETIDRGERRNPQELVGNPAGMIMWNSAIPSYIHACSHVVVRLFQFILTHKRYLEYGDYDEWMRLVLPGGPPVSDNIKSALMERIFYYIVNSHGLLACAPKKHKIDFVQAALGGMGMVVDDSVGTVPERSAQDFDF